MNNEILISYIERNVNVRSISTNRAEIAVRCPYCGDSKKSKTSTHFYIETEAPFRYECKRCGASGSVTNDTLKDLAIYDNELGLYITKEKINHRKNSGKRKIWSSKRETELPLLFRQDKLDYLNGRFDINIGPEEWITKFRTVFAFEELYRLNNIIIDGKNAGIVKMLERDYVGFLSMDKSYVICRDITDKNKKRYFNLNLYNITDGSNSKIYTIPNKIDVLHNKIKLVSAEGVFDIIGTFLHVYNSEYKDDVAFAACAGLTYNSVVNLFVNLGFLDIDLEIYSDNTVDNSEYVKLKRNNVALKKSKIKIIKNTKAKDLGVPKDKISLVESII